MTRTPPEIIYRKTVDLDQLHNNPRYINDPEFEELCTSLTNNPDYFEARPLILSNRTGMLIVLAGNMRLKAAVHIGQKEVPTILLEGLTEEREKEITIRDNVNNGSWDYKILEDGDWDKQKLVDWGVPAMWDLEGEEYEPEKVKNPSVPRVTIEFTDELQRSQFLTELDEILKSYEGAKVK